MPDDKTLKKGALKPSKGIRRPGASRNSSDTASRGSTAQYTTQRGAASASAAQTTAKRSASARQGDRRSNTTATTANTKRRKSSSGIRRPGSGATVLPNTTSTSNRTALLQNDASNHQSEETKRFHKDFKRKRRRVALTVTIILLSIGVVFFFSYLSYTYMIDNIKNPVTADSIILDNSTSLKFRVERSESTESISTRLYSLGLIKNKTIYRVLSKFNGYDGAYKAGTYTLSDGLSYEEIMVILSGTPETVKITFPEGFTTSQIAARLEANNVCSQEAFYAAVANVDISSYTFLQNTDLHDRDHRLDGYLFPDTYQFDVLAEPEDVVYKMLDRFNAVFKPSFYEKLDTLGLTLDEVVILASIVEKEARLDSDRTPIAGVFYNRYFNTFDTSLKRFQSCATLRYVHKKLFDTDLINITTQDEAVEDPYNTYIYEGFTPGPICSPGLASIEAALNPQTHGYYYFVAKTDGSGGHIFSRTYEEHLAAQRAQQ